MNMDKNKLPAGYDLPKEYQGKKLINHPDTIQVVIGDEHTDPEYKVLCTDHTYVQVPFSALRDLKAEEEAAAKAAAEAQPAAAQ